MSVAIRYSSEITTVTVHRTRLADPRWSTIFLRALEALFGGGTRKPPASANRTRVADPRRRSLFHRWAAADLASRDLVFPLSCNPARR